MFVTLSVVIPLYNSERTIHKCLESVFESSSEILEVIVVDDCSTDLSAEIAQKFNIKYIKNEVNKGPGASRNVGIHHAQGDLVLFIDSDVMLNKQAIYEIKKYFESNKDCQTVSFNLCTQDNLKNNFFTDYKNCYMNFILSKFEEDLNFVYGASCVTRKRNITLWPEEIRYTEDSLWGYWQHLKGHKINVIKSIKLIHLKEYNFKKLFINDFLISAYFALSYFKYNRWETLYTTQNFGHTSKKQKSSLIVIGLMLLFILVEPAGSPILFILWFCLNLDFFIFLSSKRHFSFVLKSVMWTFVDHIIYLLGIVYGAFLYLNTKKEKTEKVTA